MAKKKEIGIGAVLAAVLILLALKKAQAESGPLTDVKIAYSKRLLLLDRETFYVTVSATYHGPPIALRFVYEHGNLQNGTFTKLMPGPSFDTAAYPGGPIEVHDGDRLEITRPMLIVFRTSFAPAGVPPGDYDSRLYAAEYPMTDLPGWPRYFKKQITVSY